LKAVLLAFGLFSPAFASSPHSYLAPGFTRQSGLKGHNIAPIFVFWQNAEKTGLSAQAFVNKRDGSGILLLPA